MIIFYRNIANAINATYKKGGENMKNVLRGYQSMFGDITEKELETIQAAGRELEKTFLQFQTRRGYDQTEKAATTRNSYGHK